MQRWAGPLLQAATTGLGLRPLRSAAAALTQLATAAPAAVAADSSPLGDSSPRGDTEGAVVLLRDVTIRAGSEYLLENVSLRVDQGEKVRNTL